LSHAIYTVLYIEIYSSNGGRKGINSLTKYREEFAFNEAVVKADESPVVIIAFSVWN
jgi:hypothetical protein